MRRSIRASTVIAIGLVLAVAVRANESSATSELVVTEIPSVHGGPETRSAPFLAWPKANSSTLEYAEREYLVSVKAALCGYAAPSNVNSIPSAIEIVKPPVPYATRYRTTKRFQRRFRRAVQKSVQEGFILPADAASLRAELKQIEL